MSYRDLIMSQVDTVYQKGIANKILQFMQKIRNEYDEGQARRWAMELLQNGRDVAYPDRGLKARFELYDDRLVYCHTGQTFRVKDILSIIYQVSSKQPGGDSVGQFGTGFMSTYQLCEKVQLESILKDAEEAYCPFQVMLDRTGTEAAEILKKIQESVEQIYASENTAWEGTLDKDQYNTKFTYYLEKPLNKQTAQIGMRDMKENVLFVMLFSSKVQEITLIERHNETQREVAYFRGMDELLDGTNNIRRLCIVEKDMLTNQMKEHKLLYIEQNGIILAVGMDETNCFLPFSPKTSRLFIDFPLIGSESFPFPAVVNSRRLQPNEPRSGIALSDNVNSIDSRTNKEVMREAVELYGRLFAFAVQQTMKGLEHLIWIPEQVENKEHSTQWVRANVYKQLYHKIAQHPFLITNHGNKALSDIQVSLIRHIATEEGKGVRNLVLQLQDYCVPVDNTDWLEALSGYDFLQERILDLSTLLMNAEAMLKKTIATESDDVFAWCQQLYQLGMKNPEMKLLIQSGQVRIYPSQSTQDIKDYKLYTAKELRVDTGISEIAKDVSEQLDILKSALEEPLHIRKVLLRKEFCTNGEVPEFDRSKLWEYIRRRSDRKFSVTGFSLCRNTYETAWRTAWELLLSCGEDEKLYKLYQTTIQSELKEYCKEEMIPQDLFLNSYRNICREMIAKIQTYETCTKLKEGLFAKETEGDAYDWLNGVLERSFQYLLESEVLDSKIFPNQEGKFVTRYIDIYKDGYYVARHWLSIDEINKSELKEILYIFSDKQPECNLYNELLDKRICLNKNVFQRMYDDGVSMKLNTVVQKLLTEHNISDVEAHYQDACTKLLAFIQDNEDYAKKYFPGLCTEEEQMRLLAPKAAVRMSKQVKQIEKLLKECGCSSIEEVQEKMHQMKVWENICQNANGDLSDGYWYGDVYVDNDWKFSSDSEKANFLRKVGLAGEQYAFAEICRAFSDWKEEEKTDSHAIYWSKEHGIKAEVRYPDTEFYKQSGWDISIRFRGKSEVCYYVEVKTHTTTSIVNHAISLSKEQMKMAFNQKDKYAVMLVQYQKSSETCTKADVYQDIWKLWSKSILRTMDDTYTFYV